MKQLKLRLYRSPTVCVVGFFIQVGLHFEGVTIIPHLLIHEGIFFKVLTVVSIFMDGCLHKIFYGPTEGCVNGQPIIPVTILSIYSIGLRVIDHNEKFSPPLNVGGSKKLLTPLNGQVNNLIGLVHG